MKSLFWLMLVLIIPLSVRSQDRLFFHATVIMPAEGSQTVEYGNGVKTKPFQGNVKATIDDSIPLVPGNNLDTLGNAMILLEGGGASYHNPASCSFYFDEQSTVLRNVKIESNGLFHSFSASLDSLSVIVLTDSTWTVAETEPACTYSCHYEYFYLLPNHQDGKLVADGDGNSTLTTHVATGRVQPYPHSSSIRINPQGNGVVEFEVGPSISRAIEIVDALGRPIYTTSIIEDVIRITHLRPGCYFARLGTEVAKFIVME
jgi:hypothetical protein